MELIHLVANKTWGGGEQYVYDLVSSLKADGGCNVAVVCRDIPAVSGRFEAQGIAVRKMNLGGYLDIRSVVALSKVIDSCNDGCIIHAHDFKRAFVAVAAKRISRNKNVRVVMTRHLIRKAKNGLFEMSVYDNIDQIIFVSQLAKEEFLSSSPKINPDKCIVIHNGVKDLKCGGDGLKAKFGVGDDEFVMMFHGRIVPEKGIDVIIDALKKIGTRFLWRMFFVGDDTSPFATSAKNRLKDCGLDGRVVWAGYQSDVSKWIGGCDCGLMPTFVPEAFGLSNVEYMMAGKTVVTTSNGAQKEYIENGVTGMLVPVSDADALADAVVSLRDSKSYITIGRNARRYYEQHLSFSVFYDKMREVYRLD